MSQTDDNLAQLEQRVEGLIQQIETTQRANLELREENLRMKQEIENLASGQQDGAALQSEVERLNEELTTMSGREGLIRERLQGMLEKIDSIEKEIQTSSATAD